MKNHWPAGDFDRSALRSKFGISLGVRAARLCFVCVSVCICFCVCMCKRN